MACRWCSRIEHASDKCRTPNPLRDANDGPICVWAGLRSQTCSRECVTRRQYTNSLRELGERAAAFGPTGGLYHPQFEGFIRQHYHVQISNAASASNQSTEPSEQLETPSQPQASTSAPPRPASAASNALTEEPIMLVQGRSDGVSASLHNSANAERREDLMRQRNTDESSSRYDARLVKALVIHCSEVEECMGGRGEVPS